MNGPNLEALAYNNPNRNRRLGPVSLRMVDLIGPPPASECPVNSLPPKSRLAFMELKKNTGAPDAVILAWILVPMAAAEMRRGRVKAPKRDVDVLSIACITASPPGTGKSPVYRRVKQPFENFDVAALAKRKKTLDEHDPDLASWTAKTKGLSRLLNELSGSKKPEDVERAKEVDNELKDLVRRRPVKPRSRRMLKTSASFIRILQALQGDGESMLLATDEGSKLLKQIVKGDPDHFNQIFDGSTIIHEQNNLDLVITNPLACFGINTHPEPFMEFIKHDGNEAIVLGVLPRCFIAIEWDETEADEDDDDDDDADLWHHVNAFNAVNAKHIRIPDNTEDDVMFEPVVLEFSQGAKKKFKNIKQELKVARRPAGFLHGIRPFARKAPQLISRVAGVFHLSNEEDGLLIAGETLEKALDVVIWYLLQAKEIFVNQPLRVEMKRLLDFLHDCYVSKRHYSHARTMTKMPTWIPKTYVERGLRMKVDVLDQLLGILEDKRVVYIPPRATGMVYIQLAEQHFLSPAT